MEHIECLSQSFIGYVRGLFIPVFLGFFFSGLINEFVPQKLVQRYLGDDSFKSIFMATWVGVLLPVCCMGSLPIAITLRKKGARLGPILAFLVATPATSIPVLLVSWKLMGLTYTIFMAATVIVMGLMMGMIGSFIKISAFKEVDSCPDCCTEAHDDKPYRVRAMNVLRYAFIELPRKIGFEILIGAVVASVIVSFASVREFLHVQLSGFKGYVLLVLVGLVDYVCSTASVPVAHALTQSGVSLGKSMVYLLMGPITSYSTILVIRKEFGGKVLLVYLFVISTISILAGLTYDLWLS